MIQEVYDMNKYIGKDKKQQSNNLSRQEDLPHKHSPSPHNDERNGGDCKYSANNKYIPQFQGEHGMLCNPRYHEQTLPLSPPEPIPKTPEQEINHTYLEALSRSASDSSSLADSCSSDNISDRSSSLSELPSEEETDSREGMDRAEKHPDLEGGGGTGMAKDCSLGEELRGNGAAPIQQVQGWDLKKDR